MAEKRSAKDIVNAISDISLCIFSRAEVVKAETVTLCRNFESRMYSQQQSLKSILSLSSSIDLIQDSVDLGCLCQINEYLLSAKEDLRACMDNVQANESSDVTRSRVSSTTSFVGSEEDDGFGYLDEGFSYLDI
mmetsp:Transcript_1483/g.2055  ORF Transcript_1483/g.2055 Transcript_1483/m.2055 type:complete len:134 (-) Transcript_1483:105-506(-)